MVDDYITSKKKLIDIMNEHDDDIKELAVIAGNSANMIFPKLVDAFEEINHALGLRPKPPR